MQLPNDNRVILAVGAGLAILAAVVLAVVFMGGGNDRGAPPEVEPSEPGALSVDVADAPELQPTRELRCFVDGQFVGMATLADCAERNGLATDGLDVGLDASGNLAAAATASFAPPPTAPAAQDGSDNPQPATTVDNASPRPIEARSERVTGAPCLRYTGSEWRQLSGAMSLNECVQALYAGTCVGPGEAQYGRHGNLTLRLVPRRVEQSNDNTRFRVLAEQDRACQFPGLG
ncbi:hypothetical protein IP78_11400 [Brevundimonas sp. AAP58]|uniref:hypothetical protein n=1 Tax=Brevundimonas sp. AAP58 TaxID=1523422 RepID=UPI0006B90DF8|nr:hypothetical protein [Brevundimonas sp. AAP58]KPF78069.1 hypothetical protein IP78_11400 [Brevundimonas sp. AAP58]